MVAFARASQGEGENIATSFRVGHISCKGKRSAVSGTRSDITSRGAVFNIYAQGVEVLTIWSTPRLQEGEWQDPQGR